MVALAPVAAYLIIQLPSVQTKVAKEATRILSQKLDGEVQIGRVYYVMYDKLILRDVTVLSSPKDTLIGCKKLTLSFVASDIISGKLNIKRVRMEDGIFSLVSEEENLTNLDRVFRLKKGEKTSGEKGGEMNLNVKDIRLKNFRFKLNNPFANPIIYGDNYINFSDLNVSGIDIDIRDVNFKGDTLHANIRNISCTDKSMFKISKLKGNLELSSHEARVNNLFLDDGFSKISAGHFSMKYDSSKDFKYFTDKVYMELDMKDSYLSFQTIGKITPALDQNRLGLFATGMVEGTVSNLSAKNLILSSESGLTRLDADFRISGLPRASETMAFVDINNCNTTSLDLAYIIAALNSRKPIEVLKNLSPFVKYSFKGGLAGLLNDFVANGRLTSNIGEIDLDILLRQNRREGGMELKGRLSTNNFNVGSLIQNSALGEMSISGGMTALLRNEHSGGNRFLIDSINIKKMHLKGYDYSNIIAVGSLDKERFDGKIICHDPNLDFIFQGLFGLSGDSDSYYDFYADVLYADISKLKIDNRDSISVLQFKTLANFVQSPLGDIFGDIDIKGLNYTNSQGDHNIGDIRLKSISKSGDYSANLTSEFASISYKGGEIFTTFISKLEQIIFKDHIPSIFKSKKSNLKIDNKSKQSDFSMEINFLNTDAIGALILPGFAMERGSKMSISYNRSDSATIKITTPKVSYKGYAADSLSIILNASKKSSNVIIDSRSSNVNNLPFDRAKVISSLSNNKLTSTISFKNKNGYNSSMNLNNSLYFDTTSLGRPIYRINIMPSDLSFNKTKWSIKRSEIEIGDSLFTIKGFRLFNNNQALEASGRLTSGSDDTLKIKTINLDISPINLFVKKPFNFKGFISGNIDITDWFTSPRVFMDVMGKDLVVYGNSAGNLEIKSEWDNPNRLFNLFIKNSVGDNTPFNISGTYTPSSTELDLKARFDNMSIAYFEPFLSDIINRSSGYISGDMILKGPLKQLELTSSNSSFNDLKFTVNFTNVEYLIDGPISLTRDFISFNNAIIKDRFGNKGTVSGGLKHNYFNNIELDTKVDFSNLEALNTAPNDNPAFYGTAYGTGSISISGPLSKIFLDLAVTTNKNTSIHIPLSSSAEASKTNLLSFKEKEKQKTSGNKEMQSDETPQKKGSELQVRLKTNVTPEASMQIEINKEVGDVITSYGSGLITMDVNPSKDIFLIHGDYIIDRGDYQLGYALKKFQINQGGNITFNGDILKTNLNLTASYKTKASINTLIADTSSVGNRRTVDCQIKMSGPLMNPALSFNIDIPDIDPTTKARVSAALNSEDKVIKQVMSLLISGSFIPDVQSNIVNNTNILYSNLSEILSNQINNIFNQLEIPLDLNFNYQQSSSGRDIFDAAISAQLLNNRVVVNGNIGNTQYENRAGNVVGDLEVEVKLDNKGKVRAKAFSRSADKYSNYLDGSQRNGVGIVYQEEFSSFKELFQKLFKRRNRVKNGSLGVRKDSLGIRKDSLCLRKDSLSIKADTSNIKNSKDILSFRE